MFTLGAPRADAAMARAERARQREAAGWDPALVSALNILEYGCDFGSYDDEVAAVTKLAEHFYGRRYWRWGGRDYGWSVGIPGVLVVEHWCPFGPRPDPAVWGYDDDA